MVHELLGINNNRIDLSKVPGISKDLQVSKILFKILDIVTYCTYMYHCSSETIVNHKCNLMNCKCDLLDYNRCFLVNRM